MVAVMGPSRSGKSTRPRARAAIPRNLSAEAAVMSAAHRQPAEMQLAYSAIRALERDAYEVTLRGRCRLLPYDPCRLMWRASAAALGTASGSASAIEECVEMSFAASRIWFG